MASGSTGGTYVVAGLALGSNRNVSL